MPLPFKDFQAKGLLDFSSSSSPDPIPSIPPQVAKQQQQRKLWFSCGGGGGGGASTGTTNGVGAAGGSSPSVDEKCGPQLGMEDWESGLDGSPSQEQSILRLIMGDVEDPSLGLNKLLQSGSRSQDMELSASCFGVVDQVFGFEVPNMSTASASLLVNHNSTDPSSIHGLFQQHQQHVAFDQDEKPRDFESRGDNQPKPTSVCAKPGYALCTIRRAS
ncbi:hypothetical protein OIU74_010970 [Salix koriyanagi]|uniref:Uncharacterized protein n=1 Tax=Salix koriyanagi TaxID=2511006 RepID=A0A9Q0TE59_9ROSI|nr:hypothetical protein OIU74_010970 [Salix koriyanagi]